MFDRGKLGLFKKPLFYYILISCIVISYFINSAFQNPLEAVSDYKIYYGESNEGVLQQLGNYDLVIIEPHEYSKKQVAEINNQGTLTFGYISVMELEKWNTSFVEKVKEENYYSINHKKIYISEWDTYLMDISNRHYQTILLDEIQTQINDKGFHGIFLDTVGDIDDHFLTKPQELQKMRNGYLELLKQIKHQNNSLLFIQNWGFDTYKTTSRPYVDGIVWENFNKNRIENDQWSQNWISYFRENQKKGKLAILTVAPNKQGKNYSETFGFTSYVNKNSNYNEWKNASD